MHERSFHLWFKGAFSFVDYLCIVLLNWETGKGFQNQLPVKCNNHYQSSKQTQAHQDIWKEARIVSLPDGWLDCDRPNDTGTSGRRFYGGRIWLVPTDLLDSHNLCVKILLQRRFALQNYSFEYNRWQVSLKRMKYKKERKNVDIFF